MAKILIAGCGYVGTVLGQRLVTEGHEVWGLRRNNVGSIPKPIHPFPADLTKPQTLSHLPAKLDYLFYTAGSDNRSETAYRAAYVEGITNLLHALQQQGQRPKRLFFTSSTSVYGQSNGEWVDEESPTKPSRFSGRFVLQGEHLLLDGPFPATILRLGGIYGPGRTQLIDKVREGKASCTAGPPQYTNRIHRDDAASALHHLMTLDNPTSLYLGVDHEPTERCTVYRWLAKQLGVPEPPVVPNQASGRGTNKRCRNDRLLASGYTFTYPTFREGYTSLLDE